MSQKKIIFLLLACSLLAYSQTVISQIRPDSSYQIAELEKKSFERLFQDKRVGNAQGLTRTVASNNFDVNYYRCEWEIDPNLRFIKGKITSYFAITAATDNVVYDLSDTLQVDSITYRGVKINFQSIANDGLQIKFPSIMPNGQRDSISIYYQGTPRSAASSSAFVQFSHDGMPVIWTLSEPYGAKEWWPSKNGLDDKADSIDIIILSPAAYSGTGNGILRSEDISGGTKTVRYHHSYPIASYLIGIAVTNYTRDIDSIQLGNKFVPIVLNAYPERLSDFKFAGYIAKQVFPKFNELFGDYPFLREHYSQTEWSSNGGMEHQTNTFIGTTNKQTIAHELAHQWFGDEVTCGSWQHIWLNEGFANYAQFLYVQNFDTALIKAHLEYYTNLITSEADGSVFVTDTSSSNRIFDNRLTYAKGGYVVHMLRGVLGDSMFFKGVKQYLNDPLLKNKFALTADLERNLEKVSGRDLSSFFKKWIYGEGYANYSATWSQNKNNWVKVQINQTTSDPSSVSFYDMPVQLQFKNSSKDTIITVDNRQNGEFFWINPGFAADTMLIDPQYWILARERNVAKSPVTSALENDIKIYPNPASDHISIQLLNPTIKTLNIHLYSITGQLVYKHQEKLVGHDELLTVPVSGLSGGIYVLKLSDTSLLKTKKIIVR